MKIKDFVNELLFRGIHGFFFMLGLVPESVAWSLSRWVGRLWFKVDGKHRRVALENLRVAFSDEKSEAGIDRLAREVFVHSVVMVFEMGRSMHWKDEELADQFRYYGLDHLRQALKKGKGVLVLTGHLGNWELLPQAALAAGVNASAVYRPLDFKPLDRFIREMRERYGCKMYPLRKAIEGILHELGEGHMVGLLIDQNAKRRQGVFVDFFGKPASANKGMAQLALSTGAPVVPFFVLRDKGRFRAEIGAEVPLVRTGDTERDIVANTARYNKVIEAHVRRYPHQWFWVHKRWKNRPPEETEARNRGGLQR